MQEEEVHEVAMTMSFTTKEGRRSRMSGVCTAAAGLSRARNEQEEWKSTASVGVAELALLPDSAATSTLGQGAMTSCS